MIEKYITKLTYLAIGESYPRKWYHPIFVVKSMNKPDNFSIVWDTAAVCKGTSLNSCLKKGPDLLTPLIMFCLTSELEKIGINGDISVIFHRVAVHDFDCHSQRFLSRNCN